MKRFLTIALSVLVVASTLLLLPGCTKKQPETTAGEPPVDRNVAIIIAEANLPSSVIEEASVQTLWDENKWTVHFLLTGNNTVKKDELGWTESLINRFLNQGSLPVDTYRLLTIGIDRRTGIVLSRQASDSVLLGGPGTFNTEPPENTLLPLWSAIASGIGGLVIGGLSVWLFMHRRKVTA